MRIGAARLTEIAFPNEETGKSEEAVLTEEEFSNAPFAGDSIAAGPFDRSFS